MSKSCRVVSLLLLALCATTARSQDLPPGWRFPSAKEIAEPARKDNPSAYAKAVADFNGDGVDDEAILLKSVRFSGEALWVRLSGGNHQFTWVKLDEIDWGKQYPNVDLSMGIDVLPPGVYAYGCFDGAKECNFGPDESRPKLNLHNPSLAYYKMESAGSLFFWSKKHKRFMRVWISD